MKIIFLDVDGVLNYVGSKERLHHGCYFVEDEKVALLYNLVRDTGAEIVLSSSWRSGWSFQPGQDQKKRFDVDCSQPYFMLCAKLNDFGLSFLSETPMLQNSNREEDISYWLQEWPGRRIDNYVILDDEATYFSENNEHLILVSSKTGLLPEHIQKAKQLLNTEKPRILVVDDIEVNREVMKAALEPDYVIYEAKDGKTALTELEKHDDIDLVITDIQMPGMDGIKLIKSIRSNRNYNNVPIIANTQYGDPEQEETILDLGANDFVYKPSTPKIIQLRVKNALRIIMVPRNQATSSKKVVDVV